eukprot:CAMPEP_0170618428 /NCGR_PEP_ID=MMETSP0224-20130122/26956_1 /TAXON_ID=285029 /ORGANISM="Togula jolla, Strain CCCM 725" /LENGTH=251 /DNA_ID=CAMNT_0010944407 /DNA_START=49 /DNA_END=801 /DNA_ORIENTATION=-
MAYSAKRAVRYAACGTVGLGAAALGQVIHLKRTYVSPSEPEGVLHGHAGRGFTGKPLNLLFIGDSVCMGVGATIAGPLQAACAERLAALREVPVVWQTIAATGADVRELSDLILNGFGTSGSSSKSFDIAVVFCGVNDGKKFLEGRSPSIFKEDLAKLCATLRDQAPSCRISVPCIPGYMHAPELQSWPMRFLVRFLFGQFEAQKTALAETVQLHCPTPALSCLPKPEERELWASDGIHPSGEGYRRVGEW